MTLTLKKTLQYALSVESIFLISMKTSTYQRKPLKEMPLWHILTAKRNTIGSEESIGSQKPLFLMEWANRLMMDMTDITTMCCRQIWNESKKGWTRN